jgi:hypothetical protein
MVLDSMVLGVCFTRDVYYSCFVPRLSSSFLSAIRMLYNLMVQWSKDLVIQKFSSPIVHFSDGLLVRKLHDLKFFQIFLLFVKCFYLIHRLNRMNNVDFVQNVCLKDCQICMHLILIFTQTSKNLEFFLSYLKI